MQRTFVSYYSIWVGQPITILTTNHLHFALPRPNNTLPTTILAALVSVLGCGCDSFNLTDAYMTEIVIKPRGTAGHTSYSYSLYHYPEANLDAKALPILDYEGKGRNKTIAATEFCRRKQRKVEQNLVSVERGGSR
jgi:hypothetical protein